MKPSQMTVDELERMAYMHSGPDSAFRVMFQKIEDAEQDDREEWEIDTTSDLEKKIDEYEQRIMALQDEVEGLQERISELEAGTQ